MNTTSRNHNLDVLRLLAIVMVIIMHAPLPGCASGPVLSGLSYLTAPSIGLLFMVSGALLLDNRHTAGTFLRRRFGKVALPTLFWTLFYIAEKHITSTPPASYNSLR